MKTPILKGYIDGCQIVVWCPFCTEWHKHGVTDNELHGKMSHRVAHCTSETSPFHSTSYYVKKYSKSELNKINGVSM